MEEYVLQPAEVEVFYVEGGTDVIIRKNIHQTEIANGEPNHNKVTMWVCDELHGRVSQDITIDEVMSDIDGWWNILQKPLVPARLPTQEERLKAVESTTNDLTLLMADMIGGAM